jgi:hypothetical protein
MTPSIYEASSYKSLGLESSLVVRVIEFLVEHGLCLQDKKELRMGPASTYLDSRSPLINLHRRNWRLKALEKVSQQKEADLFYSSVVSLSHEDFVSVRKTLLLEVEKFSKKIEQSEPKKLACINIDWFEV